MAQPKITRLNDPANPYGQKKSPTGRPQDKPKPAPATVTVRKTTVTPAAKPKAGLIPRLNQQYGGGARVRAIDAMVEGKTSPKRK